jgi:hypothetical protein
MNDNLLGVLPDMDNDAYHASPAIGSSGLKRFAVTPLHYWADFLDPERERKDKKAFRIGRAWHCAVFEPHAFGERYVDDHGVNKLTNRAKALAELLALPGDQAAAELLRWKGVPDDIKATTKEGKALYAEIEAEGKRPMPESDLDWITTEAARMHSKDVLPAADTVRVQKMAAIARALPISRVVFEQMAAHGAAETSLFWVDPDSGVLLKIRPDFMLTPCPAFPNGLIIDGKSTTDASVQGFGRQVWNLDYGLQAAIYTKVFQGVFKTAGRPPFLWLGQEKDSPHAARYYSAGDDLIAHWDRRIAAMLPAVKRCQDTGVWPGYPETVETLALPAWAEKQIAEAA